VEFKYKEYDIPRTEQIEKFMKMSDEERNVLLEKVLEEDREQHKALQKRMRTDINID